jgi:hypothetical protein
MVWAIPAWSVLCGAIVSGEMRLTLATGVQLVIVLLLVEVGWGTVWTALATTDWARPLRRWRYWHLGEPGATVPYAQPGSPAARLTSWLSELRSWYRSVLAPTAGPAVGAIGVGAIFSFLLAVVAGRGLLQITLTAFALMQLAVTLEGGRNRPGAGWDAALRLGLPWLAGHLAFASLSLPSLALAAAFSVSVAGSGASSSGWARGLWTGGQVAAAVLFVPLQRPLTVLFVLLLLFPQWLATLRMSSERATDPQGWVRRAWPWLTASMLLAAWSL